MLLYKKTSASGVFPLPNLLPCFASGPHCGHSVPQSSLLHAPKLEILTIPSLYVRTQSHSPTCSSCRHLLHLFDTCVDRLIDAKMTYDFQVNGNTKSVWNN